MLRPATVRSVKTRRPERVQPQDAPVGHALRPRHGHVILLQRLDHVAAEQAREPAIWPIASEIAGSIIDLMCSRWFWPQYV